MVQNPFLNNTAPVQVSQIQDFYCIAKTNWLWKGLFPLINTAIVPNTNSTSFFKRK